MIEEEGSDEYLIDIAMAEGCTAGRRPGYVHGWRTPMGSPESKLRSTAELP
jgi:hypothetical protein